MRHHEPSTDRLLKVGEVSELAGVSVRTLHHYQDVGLLTPATRSMTGYRLYNTENLVRLQQITSLREVGLSLAEIKDFLNAEGGQAWESLQMHILALEEKISDLQSLRQRLQILLEQSTRNSEADSTFLLAALREINQLSRHFSPEQIGEFKRRARELGTERIEQGQQRWRKVLEEFSRLAEQGSAPDCAAAEAAATEAMRLMDDVSGGDVQLESAIAKRYQTQGAAQVLQQNGMKYDRAGWELMQQAMQHLRCPKTSE